MCLLLHVKSFSGVHEAHASRSSVRSSHRGRVRGPVLRIALSWLRSAFPGVPFSSFHPAARSFARLERPLFYPSPSPLFPSPSPPPDRTFPLASSCRYPLAHPLPLEYNLLSGRASAHGRSPFFHHGKQAHLALSCRDAEIVFDRAHALDRARQHCCLQAPRPRGNGPL